VSLHTTAVNINLHVTQTMASKHIFIFANAVFAMFSKLLHLQLHRKALDHLQVLLVYTSQQCNHSWSAAGCTHRSLV